MTGANSGVGNGFATILISKVSSDFQDLRKYVISFSLGT